MAYRRRRQFQLPDDSNRYRPNNVDQLAFTYMEMCKVESSTDSDSEISPRWSDTSTMGCVSSAPESGTLRRTFPLTYKPAGRHGSSLFLDPYDGSSEDSDESNIDLSVSSRRTRQGKSGGGGSSRFLGRNRKFTFHHVGSFRDEVKSGMRDLGTEQQHLLDVQMKCGSDSELWVCDCLASNSDGDDCGDPKEKTAGDSTMHAQTMDVELDCQFEDSGVHVPRSCTPQAPGPVTLVEGNSSQMLDSSSERSPSPYSLRYLYKRKLGFYGAEWVEPGQRKRKCVAGIEPDREEGGSASDLCLSHLNTD